MSVDYNVSGVPAPPTTPPPPTPPPPQLPPSNSFNAAVQATVTVRPKVDEISILVRRVVFVDGPSSRGTKEVTVGMKGTPDPAAPASASLDRLAAACQTKLRTYLDELG